MPGALQRTIQLSLPGGILGWGGPRDGEPLTQILDRMWAWNREAVRSGGCFLKLIWACRARASGMCCSLDFGWCAEMH